MYARLFGLWNASNCGASNGLWSSDLVYGLSGKAVISRSGLYTQMGPSRACGVGRFTLPQTMESPARHEQIMRSIFLSWGFNETSNK